MPLFRLKNSIPLLCYHSFLFRHSHQLRGETPATKHLPHCDSDQVQKCKTHQGNQHLGLERRHTGPPGQTEHERRQEHAGVVREAGAGLQTLDIRHCPGGSQHQAHLCSGKGGRQAVETEMFILVILQVAAKIDQEQKRPIWIQSGTIW